MIWRLYHGGRSWLALHWRRVALIAAVGLLAIIIAVQFIYPAGRLLPFASIDGQSFGGWSKADVITSLNAAYADLAVDIHFGEGGEPYRSPKLSELGMTADNTVRVVHLNYPWYLRLVPTSILWAHLLVKADVPDYQRDHTKIVDYVQQTFGSTCQIEPRNASLKASGDRLELVRAQAGGTCAFDEVISRLGAARPTLDNKDVTIPVSGIDPQVTNDQANALATAIMGRLSDEVVMKAGEVGQTIPTAELLSWLDFAVVEGQLTASVNHDRSASFFTEKIAPNLLSKPGTTTVTTYDYLETSRQTGPDGYELDVEATITELEKFIDGEIDTISAVTKVTPATIVYTRNYSNTDTGLSALMQNYAQTHGGTYAVSLVELSGKRRHASYRGNVQYTTASTYKLFVAYSTLRRVEAGTWQWTDQIHGGRDLAKCFDDMIVKSDNECAHAMLDKIGFREITNEARAIGAVNTSFLGNNGIKSTAEDEAVLLALLYSNQILSQQASRDRFVDALKRNIYRQGIPKGVPGATVANKVGFLDALLHDAAIVYSPTGNYVLVILTEGASWANIAELTREIEALRKQ